MVSRMSHHASEFSTFNNDPPYEEEHASSIIPQGPIFFVEQDQHKHL